MSYPTEIATVLFRYSTKMVCVQPGTDPLNSSENLPYKKGYNDILCLVFFKSANVVTGKTVVQLGPCASYMSDKTSLFTKNAPVFRGDN